MPELKEVFEMVTKQTEPDLESWTELERRHRKAARDRRLGAFGVAAVLGIVTLLVAVRIANDEPTPGPVITPPSVETGADLYVVDPETGQATVLLAAPGGQTNPERSPDGSRVVYQSEVGGGPSQIFVLEPDGIQRQLTSLEQGAQDPTWSPDGRQIAFAGRGPDADIFVMNADGTRIRRLTGTPARASHPDWSPDGSRIVFQSRASFSGFCCERFDIWVTSVPDATLTRLPLRFLPYGAYPAWSPDGRWIALTVASGGSSGDSVPYAFLRLVRPDGSRPQRVGDGSPYGHLRRNPSWSPDGRSIVFGAQNDICIIDVETGEDSVRCLDTGGGESPSWDSEGILFSRDESD